MLVGALKTAFTTNIDTMIETAGQLLLVILNQGSMIVLWRSCL